MIEAAETGAKIHCSPFCIMQIRFESKMRVFLKLDNNSVQQAAETLLASALLVQT